MIFEIFLEIHRVLPTYVLYIYADLPFVPKQFECL